MKYRLFTTITLNVWLLSLLAFSATLLAGQCSATFPDGASSNSASGSIVFGKNSAVYNNPDSVLASPSVDSGSQGFSCYTADCTATGSPSDVISLTDFSFSASTEVTVKKNKSETIGTTGNYTYKLVKLERDAALTFSSLTAYGITKLEIGKNSSVNLPAGDYYIDELIVGQGASIVPIGTGTVRLYLGKDASFAKGSQINSIGTNPSRLFIYAYKKISTGQDSLLNAYIYAVDQVTLGKGTVINGAVSAKDMFFGQDARIFYDSSNIANTYFVDACTGGAAAPDPLIAEYRFDECSLASTIIDTQGNYDATGHGLTDSSANAVIGQSLDLFSYGTSDWVNVPLGAVHNLNNLTVSVWVNTSVSKSEQEVFHALGDGTGDDELEISLHGSSTVYLKVKDDSTDLASSITLTDGQWHQVVITREGSQGCLYVDGALQDCDTEFDSGTLSVTNDNAVVLGQEQDSFGGGFSSAQGFEGMLDELKIFSELISPADITTYYNNEKAGNNYDGTSRTPPTCNNGSTPVAEYRFDESSYTGAANEVVDNIGGFHGSATLAQPVEGKVCNAVDFSDANVTDYITLAKGSLNGRSTFSVSVWAKTSSNAAQTIISAANSGTTDELSMWFTSGTSFDPYQKGNTSGSIATSTISDNNWHHLVWTQSNSDECFYRDKVLQGCKPNNASILDIPALILGQEQDNGSIPFPRWWAFEGLIDELLIFGSALSGSQISTIYDNQNAGKGYDGSTRNCSSTTDIDHYQIIHDGQALTCATESVVIKACLDAACTSFYEDPITLNLNVGNTTVATSTLTDGIGSAIFNYTSVGDATLSVSGASQPAINAQTCLLGADNDCEMTFASAGFLVNMTEGESCQANTVTIQAVKQSDTGTSCAPAFTGSQAVNLSFDYVLPNSGSIIPALDNTPMAAAGVSQQRNMIFDGTTASAELSLSYADAGSLRLNVSASGSGPLAGLSLSGSDTATYYPGKLAITAKNGATVLNNNASSGSPTQLAGSNFSLEIAAQCDDGTVTPNYQPQTSSSIEIAAKRSAPDNTSGGVDGSLSVNNQNVTLAADLSGFTSIGLAPTAFTNGIATVTANYAEVGLIALDARDKNYYDSNAEAPIDA
ncbi:MAG: LamG domain-containing protein, partial [Psychrosphaera sp.]|nr:LamG domain-containing protein [Psychrosphaera sp.]